MTLSMYMHIYKPRFIEKKNNTIKNKLLLENRDAIFHYDVNDVYF